MPYWQQFSSNLLGFNCLDGDEHWELQEVRGSKLRYDKVMHFVRWVSFSVNDDECFHPGALDACQELIVDFHKHYLDKAGQNEKRQRCK